eukprot:SAG31_NODE_6641_length_1942_cov_1.368964_1_plen_228_part_00
MIACDRWADAAPGCKVSSANAGTPGSGCVCHGITLQRGSYQPRAASTITPDTANGEQSWLRTDARCSASSWGFHFVLVLLFGAAAYAGGGRLYNLQHGRPGWLLHAAHWAEIRNLVADGVAFTRGGFQRRGRTSRARGDGAGYQRYEERGGAQGAPQLLKADARSERARKKGSKAKTKSAGVGAADPVASTATASGRDDPETTALSVGSVGVGSAAAGGGRWVHITT